MIDYLKGKVLDQSEGRLVVFCGMGADVMGPGYGLNVPRSAEYSGLLPGQPAEFFVHTHVREDAFELFGFLSRSERELFLTLTAVNGIGPKAALGILSNIDPRALVDAILSGDKAMLTKLPGIGKKTAERVVLELSDVIQKKIEAGSWSEWVGDDLREGGQISIDSMRASLPTSRAVQDAKAALIGLGYRESDVSAALAQLAKSGEDRAAEDYIRMALKEL